MFTIRFSKNKKVVLLVHSKKEQIKIKAIENNIYMLHLISILFPIK